MGIGLYFISNSQLDNIMMLTFMLLVGGLTYVGILVVLKDSVSKIIQKTISQYFEKKKILWCLSIGDSYNICTIELGIKIDLLANL